MPPCGSGPAPVGVVGSSFGFHTPVLTGEREGRSGRSGVASEDDESAPPAVAAAAAAAAAPLR